MNDQLSSDQLNAMLNMSKITPDQSSAALGHSTGIIGQAIQGGWNALSGVATGVAQQGTKDILGAGEAIMKAGSVLPGVGQPLGQTAQSLETARQSPALQPQSTSQQVGQVGTQVGEFFAPGGLEEGAVTKGSSLIDKIPEALNITGKYASKITDALKTTLKGAVTGASMGGVTAAQTGGDIQKTKQAAELGGIAGGVSGALEAVSPGMLQSIAKSGFKLTPSAEAKASKIADNAAQFIQKNGITGTDFTKFSKVDSLTSQFESTLQTAMNKTPQGEKLQVPTEDIVSNINSKVEGLRSSDPAVYSQARNQADNAIKLIREGKINLDAKDVLSAKRSYGGMAFRTSQKGKISDPTVSAEGQFAVEQGYQEALQTAMQKTGTNINVPPKLQQYFDGAKQVTLPEFNKVYSDAINARKLLFAAQFKRDSGLFGRLFGIAVGEIAGQAIMPGPIGKIAGMTIGEMATERATGAARYGIEKTISHPKAPIPLAKGTQGVINVSQDGQDAETQ